MKVQIVCLTKKVSRNISNARLEFDFGFFHLITDIETFESHIYFEKKNCLCFLLAHAQ